jgi:hypothetical protein
MRRLLRSTTVLTAALTTLIPAAATQARPTRRGSTSIRFDDRVPNG